MTNCTFFALAPNFAQYIGDKTFDNFAAARAFLTLVRDGNLDVLESINGYVAMICAIYN